jgi:hypothetical protein
MDEMDFKGDNGANDGWVKDGKRVGKSEKWQRPSFISWMKDHSVPIDVIHHPQARKSSFSY